MSIIDLIKESNSLELLRKINNNLIPKKKFHEHTHILYDIRTLLGSSPKNYVEIGSYIGSSASLLLNHKYETNIICIDPLNLNKSHYGGILNQYTTLKNNLDRNNINNYLYKIYSNFSSDISILNIFKDINLEIDILFIDGNHCFKNVLDDFNNYKDFVVSGGYIIFDDYLDKKHSPEVKKAVDFLIEKLDKKYKIIGCVPNLRGANPLFKYSNEFILQKL